jgi:CPA2 family monovalent cation:H+ antiporter-2
MVLAVASLSMAVTPALSSFGVWLARRLERMTQIGLAALEQEHLDLRDHVVIAGFGRYGQMIARLLDANRIPYVALDMNAQRIAEMKQRGLPVNFGDATRPELLWGVGIDRAKAIVITAHEDAASEVRLVRLLRSRLPNLVIVARARDPGHAGALLAAGATEAVQDVLASSLHLAQSVIRSFGLPEGDLNQMLLEYGGR